MSTLASGQIKRSVLAMYMAHPFPQMTHDERVQNLGGEICRYRFLGLEGEMKGARFLEVGCGTGNRSMLIAKRLGVREFVGFDHSAASLAIASQVAREEEFDRFTPAEGDLFNIPFPDGSFDVVVSWGVLHHTADPLGGLREMCRLCRKGGYVGVYLYNKWNHWRHNLQKNKVSRIAGEDFERRFQVAHERYGNKPVVDMTPNEVAVFYDKYCHPHKSDHTIGETLRWFRELGLQFHGSYIPMRFGDFLRYLKFRGSLQGQYAAQVRLYGRIARMAASLPVSEPGAGPFKSPTLAHRFAWQAFWAWQGRHGGYSQGAALSVRKPE